VPQPPPGRSKPPSGRVVHPQRQKSAVAATGDPGAPSRRLGCPRIRGDAPADPRRPSHSGLAGLAGPVAVALRPGSFVGRGGHPCMGSVGISPPGAAPPCCRGDHRVGTRRPRPSGLGRTAGPAGRGRLHRRGDPRLRLRAASVGTGHECSPRHRTARSRSSRTRPVHHPSGGEPRVGNPAAAVGRRVDGVRDGTRRTGLHSASARVRGVPPRGDLSMAGLRATGGALPSASASLCGLRPPGSGSAAGRATRRRRAGDAAGARSGVAGRGSADPSPRWAGGRWPGGSRGTTAVVTAPLAAPSPRLRSLSATGWSAATEDAEVRQTPRS